MKKKFLKKKFLRPTKINLCIAGGGCKAFFGLGVGKVLVENGIKLKSVSATSAGAAMILSLVSRNEDDVVDKFCELVEKNKSNFYLSKALSLTTPFPHEEMYRFTIKDSIEVEKILSSKIKIAINTLKVPESLHPDVNRLEFVKMMAKLYSSYRKEYKNHHRGIYKNLMSEVAEEFNLEEVVFGNDDLVSERHIQDVILAASSAPPVTSLQRLSDHQYYLDGGISNNLPVSHLDKSGSIVAIYYHPITRSLFEQAGFHRGLDIHYVTPETELPVATWDYTNHIGVRKAFDIGKQAGRKLLLQHS